MTRQFLKFLVAGGIAAVANFASRMVFSMFLPYATAVVLAFGVGLTLAFALNRLFVFPMSRNPVHIQAFWFFAVNMLALAQTLGVSVLLVHILPRVGMAWHVEEIAHAAGIVVPIFTSYIGHRTLTFR